MKTANFSSLLIGFLSTISITTAFSSSLFGTKPIYRPLSPAAKSSSTLFSSLIIPSEEASQLKHDLLSRIKNLKDLQARYGEVSVDFGVKGGELNQTSRAPQSVDYYSISPVVGEAADAVKDICKKLETLNPCDEPTKYLGDANNAALSPLNGAWKLLFTTAADASFSSNSTRGDAKVQNVVDAAKGTITNIIDFSKSADGKEPALKQLNVVIKATAASKSRVELQFRYAKAVLTKFFFLPLFGRKLNLYIPVPGPFITRIIVFFSRLVKFFGRKDVEKKVPPKAYFDVLYLDGDLRIHKTGESNLFVQARESWKEARPYLK